jgi:hypothetical protein
MNTLIAHFVDVAVCVYSLKRCAELNSAAYNHARRLEDLQPLILTFTVRENPDCRYIYIYIYIILYILYVHKINQRRMMELHIMKRNVKFIKITLYYSPLI